MSNINSNARKAVNEAIVNSDQSDIACMVDAARSSVRKRELARAEREKREAEEKRLREEADAAVLEKEALKLC
ncbi:predicted protein [Uncinocarpus reesii 1704]|uniref:Uncharacterized protein n=1 Tax=Uncinocarpus reesii (strain UAMH 1704) TaxID=336963 RepID=C4JTF1_UNCRE|nr:uncharacterized protein UREG_05740 [Uncinocarpus reesii 1704]EEP80898.1 predicted protein [Uncinocarpus reesii 1704]